MNKLTNIQTARRPFQDVVRVAAPSGVIDSFAIRRRELVRTWTIDPVLGRLVCSWSQRSRGEDPSSELDAHDRAASEIPTAA